MGYLFYQKRECRLIGILSSILCFSTTSCLCFFKPFLQNLDISLLRQLGMVMEDQLKKLLYNMTSTIGATLMAKLSASILCIGVHNVCQSCNCTLSSLIFTLVDVVISIARLPQSYVSFIKLDIKTLTVSKTHSGISAEDQIGSKTVPYLVNLRGNQRKPSQLSIRTYN